MKRTAPIKVSENSVTAKIYSGTTSNGYSCFTVVWRVDGLRKREVFGSLSNAKARARQIVEALDAGQTEVAGMNRSDVEAFEQASSMLAGSGVSLVQAVREYVAALKELDGRPLMDAARYYAKTHPKDIKKMLISEVADLLFKSKLESRKDSEYIRQLAHQCGKFSTMFNKNIGDITQDDMALFRDSLSKLAPRSRNNVIAGVRELFSFAKKNKLVPKDFDQLDAVELFEDDDGEITTYTPKELAAILSKADAAAAPWIAIRAFAGLRSCEVLKLDWCNVDLEEGIITVTAKTAKKKGGRRERRNVPISKNLSAWLTPCAVKDGPFVEVGSKAFEELQTKAVTAAGLEWRKNALRHSAISYRVAQTQNVAQVALEAGNSPKVIFTNYLSLMKPAEAAAWYAITPAVA